MKFPDRLPETDRQILQKVRDFAAKAHEGQTRKYSGDPYIVHPERVMLHVGSVTNDLPMLAAALLHDVLEDTEVGEKELKDFLLECMDEISASRTMLMVIELTDVFVKSTYPGWNRRKRKSEELVRMANTTGDSQTVKYADIIDNCTGSMAAHDPHFARLFYYECRNVLKVMRQGHPELYHKASEIVNKAISEL